MGFRQVIEHSNVELTEAEQRIASILLAAPEDCLLLSAAELARRSSVHESTVIRFAQKLGYAGYPGLRADLAAEARQMGESSMLRWVHAAEPYELTSVIQHQLRTLARLPDYVTQDAIDAAARAILAARRIFVYGEDFARPLAEFMERKLRLMGFDVVVIAFGGSDAAEHLVSARAEDVLLAYIFETQRREASRLLRRVAADGMASILITDHTSVSLRPSPTHLLAAPRALEQRRTIVVPLLISYALEYSLIHLAPERITAALERVAELRQTSANDADGRVAAIRNEFSLTDGPER